MRWERQKSMLRIPFGLTSIIEDGNFEIVEKTGWKLKFRKTPSSVMYNAEYS